MARHLSSPFPPHEASKLFQTVLHHTKWRQHVGMSYQTAWMVADQCTCSYKYGRFQVGATRFPEWMEGLMKTVMPLVGINAREAWPNSCNLNHYTDGESSVGWHADDEALFQGNQQQICIVSLSLGAKRTFEIQGQWSGAKKHKIDLQSGDLLTMEGWTQYYYRHRVPKQTGAAPRINLTWRWVVKHGEGCRVGQLPARLGPETLPIS